MTESLRAFKTLLKDHPLYDGISDLESLRLFMSHHVFCVWDFMSLLKSLQRELTCVTTPWTPPAHPAMARIINEIVLDEESDVIDGVGVVSHYDLYLLAMEEVGCDTTSVRRLVEGVRAGLPIEAAMAQAEVPELAQAFLKKTFSVLDYPLAVRAAVFFHAREDVLPRIFIELVASLEAQGMRCPMLIAYLNRHIQADGEVHGPRFQELLTTLEAQDPSLMAQALDVAGECLLSRLALWDGVRQLVESLKPVQPPANVR
jgi:hypothetical protein